MTRVFVDTGVWLAAVLPRDERHAAAVAFLDEIAAGHWRGVYTSDYVIAEALNWIRKKARRLDIAQACLAHVFGVPESPPPVTAVLKVHSARFAAALEQYRTRFDRGLSFTDWTNVILMESERIDTLATFDTGFEGLVPRVVPVR